MNANIPSSPRPEELKVPKKGELLRNTAATYLATETAGTHNAEAALEKMIADQAAAILREHMPALRSGTPAPEQATPSTAYTFAPETPPPISMYPQAVSVATAPAKERADTLAINQQQEELSAEARLQQIRQNLDSLYGKAA